MTNFAPENRSPGRFCMPEDFTHKVEFYIIRMLQAIL